MASQILLGVVLGLAGAAPFSVALARTVARGPKGPGVRSGLVCIVVSALIVLVGMALVHRLWAEAFVPVSVSAVLAMLVAVTTLVLVTWHRLS
ncbi:hypothetical protein Pcatena_15230 [Parolsenella catena]|uniref:Uncharacterized protein n=1 Tax=Parolsenella catena TaxID=2003188 RepID=A0A3G9K323_9ACTN|nr:hypothetical protein [Parolsenella catena]BBH50936.1 hypothetical protein Pcatena_15230 [Parolsenella catena]